MAKSVIKLTSHSDPTKKTKTNKKRMNKTDENEGTLAKYISRFTYM